MEPVRSPFAPPYGIYSVESRRKAIETPKGVGYKKKV